jgi:hypothetical protein
VAVAASLPQGIGGVRVGKVAHAIGVVVDFSARNVAAGNANVERDVGVVWLRSLGGGVFAALRGGLVAAITQDWLQVGVAV